MKDLVEKGRITKIILWSITAIGGVLVGENIISGEAFTTIQGLTGLALTGSGVTASMVIYILGTLLPLKAVNGFLKSIKNDIGEDKYNNAMEFVGNNLPQMFDLLEKHGEDISQVLLLMKANAIVNLENGVYDDYPEAKELAEKVK